MTDLNLDINQKLKILVKKAEEFHGHLGPFLVLGLRIGIAGLRELNVKSYENNIKITAILEYLIPISCTIDGLQIATKCTLGNRKLKIKDSSEMTVKFEQENKELVTINVNDQYLKLIKKRLSLKHISKDQIREVAYQVLVAPENMLFVIRKE